MVGKPIIQLQFTRKNRAFFNINRVLTYVDKYLQELKKSEKLVFRLNPSFHLVQPILETFSYQFLKVYRVKK